MSCRVPDQEWRCGVNAFLPRWRAMPAALLNISSFRPAASSNLEPVSRYKKRNVHRKPYQVDSIRNCKKLNTDNLSIDSEVTAPSLTPARKTERTSALLQLGAEHPEFERRRTLAQRGQRFLTVGREWIARRARLMPCRAPPLLSWRRRSSASPSSPRTRALPHRRPWPSPRSGRAA